MSTSGLSVYGIPSLRTQSPGSGTGHPSWRLVSLSFRVSPESLWDALLRTVWLHGHPCPLLAMIPFCGNLLGILREQRWGPQE